MGYVKAALAFAVMFVVVTFIVRQFAPEGVKQFFRV